MNQNNHSAWSESSHWPIKPEKFSKEIGRNEDNVESYYDDQEEFNRIQNRAQVREFRQSSPEPVPNKVKENKFY